MCADISKNIVQFVKDVFDIPSDSLNIVFQLLFGKQITCVECSRVHAIDHGMVDNNGVPSIRFWAAFLRFSRNEKKKLTENFVSWLCFYDFRLLLLLSNVNVHFAYR